MGVLAERAASVESLRRAWVEVRGGAGGELGPAASRFDEVAETELVRLSWELAERSYTPQPLSEVVLEETGRVLHVPPIRDRVVEQSVLDMVTPHVDPVLGHASYAYRPGIGVRDAVRAVVDLR